MDKILIVDDQQFMRDLLSDWLSSYYACVTASDAEEAKCLMTFSEFKVVITDIEMPGCSGLDLLAHVKESHPETVVVIVSSAWELADAAEYLGAFEFIAKPFDLAFVRATVERAFEHWADSAAMTCP